MTPEKQKLYVLLGEDGDGNMQVFIAIFSSTLDAFHYVSREFSKNHKYPLKMRKTRSYPSDLKGGFVEVDGSWDMVEVYKPGVEYTRYCIEETEVIT